VQLYIFFSLDASYCMLCSFVINHVIPSMLRLRNKYSFFLSFLSLDKAQTISLNCGMTHSRGKIEYNFRYFLLTFHKRIRKKKFCKNDFHTLQDTMSHRPLTNTSSLKISAAYCPVPPPPLSLYLPPPIDICISPTTSPPNNKTIANQSPKL
jgi:hypothetical protein